MAASGASSNKPHITLRQPHPLLSKSEHNKPLLRRTIQFRRPGYPDTNTNVLLRFNAFDQPDGGLHYGTAFLACAIVSVNAFHGYLSEARDGDKLILEWDDLLLKNDYYFHVPTAHNDVVEGQSSSGSPTDKEPYPVYPTFDHWVFPHSKIPDNWLKFSLSRLTGKLDLAPPLAPTLDDYVRFRDTRCLITSSRDYVENAHVCPRKKKKWFKRNGMEYYNISRLLGGHYLLDDVSNGMAMRSDIQKAFDDRIFLISCKESKWILHFLEVTNELGSLYHNRSISLADEVSPSFVFVRFAWAIFPFLLHFLGKGISRRVCIQVEDTDNICQEEVKLAGVQELKGFTDEADACEDDRSDDWESRYASSEHDSESRGRKRFRTS